ncbi:5'/3'-nucleotidase SurE [Leucothrix pacifica]|uniref:5'-nucleotidase SurE n=1 Tax=Leucothrix pacifica TaxID=1247513 RepID=A0A317CR05_9GAMM|nr:5'/3'-nucleotidase SurE [Leucothrix pacifica]PWR00532.1 5'/3'-nucleotidase SurE [Leucothrix pacifica]
MKILLSNDDGYFAPGLLALKAGLSESAEVLTVAPNRDRSGASNSLTLTMPLRLSEHGEQIYSVDGTPTDCVHLALTGIYDNPPDLVIAGINAGPNLGDDVIYSGTVAAATEGRNLGLPALAVSCCGTRGDMYYESAVEAVRQILGKLSSLKIGANTILNINVPNLPWSEIKGFKVTRLGKRHHAEPVIRAQDPRGRDIYWVGPVGEQLDAGEGTDFHAIDKGFVSITPLHIDLTQYQAMASTEHWLQEL